MDPPFAQSAGNREDMGKEVVRRHKINIVDVPMNHGRQDFDQLGLGHVFPHTLTRDLIVLAEGALQSTARKKHGSGPSVTAYWGLFSMVGADVSYPQPMGLSAETPST